VIHSIAKFVRHHDVVDHLRLGWCPSLGLVGTHHGFDSVLMLCPVVVPPLDPAAVGPEAPL
jgi:hypothetical protein